MKQRYRLFRRRGGVFYTFDNTNGRQQSLKTRDPIEARRLLIAKNEAHQLPTLNLQLARTYLMASDPLISQRTWRHVMEEILKTKDGPTLERWGRAIKDRAFEPLHGLKILETTAEQLLQVMERGTVATNLFLRRIHNFALAMNWLPWPIVPKRQWPPARFKAKRAITLEEHRRIVERERNPERRAFYEVCWHLGGSQGDIAALTAEDVDWTHQTVAYQRRKTSGRALIHFGKEMVGILEKLPRQGPLFPYLRRVRACDRATEFKQRCQSVGVSGVTLHSYRYAWAERARRAGMPERFAQEALGHNSQAVHRAYAKQAQVRVPSLEDYEHAQLNPTSRIRCADSKRVALPSQFPIR